MVPNWAILVNDASLERSCEFLVDSDTSAEFAVL